MGNGNNGMNRSNFIEWTSIECWWWWWWWYGVVVLVEIIITVSLRGSFLYGLDPHKLAVRQLHISIYSVQHAEYSR